MILQHRTRSEFRFQRFIFPLSKRALNPQVAILIHFFIGSKAGEEAINLTVKNLKQINCRDMNNKKFYYHNMR